MPITIKIEKASVLVNRRGTDKVWLKTKLPSPFPPGVDNPYLTLSFDTVSGGGVDYVKKVFGVTPEITDALTGEIS